MNSPSSKLSHRTTDDKESFTEDQKECDRRRVEFVDGQIPKLNTEYFVGCSRTTPGRMVFCQKQQSVNAGCVYSGTPALVPGSRGPLECGTTTPPFSSQIHEMSPAYPIRWPGRRMARNSSCLYQPSTDDSPLMWTDKGCFGTGWNKFTSSQICVCPRST